MRKRGLLIICSALILSAPLLLGGCGTPKQPSAEMSRADLAIERARESRAIIYAPLDLKLAEEKLEKAKTESRDGSMEKARDLAVESEADARVAEEKARAEMASRDAQRMRQNLSERRLEIEGR